MVESEDTTHAAGSHGTELSQQVADTHLTQNGTSSGAAADQSKPAANGAAATPAPTEKCSTPDCPHSASLKCPTCIQLGMQPVAHFCSQDCFKKSWKAHNQLHKQFTAKRDYKPPSFAYTGPLRPHYVTPRRSVPDSIQKPDYALTGQPESERQARGDKTIPLYTPKEIEGIRKACAVGREVLDIAAALCKPGVTTEEIDVAVHNATIERGAYPSPLNYHGFPKACCTSVNEIVCHGIPDARPLEKGDIVNVDISVFVNGFHGDLNETYIVGDVNDVDEDSKRLIRGTYDALMEAISHVKPGLFYREIGDIITKAVGADKGKKGSLSVVRSYCGHGCGMLFHCMPNIPHYAKNKAIGIAKPGHIFTIEPMINLGTYRDVLWPDEWSSSTADGKRSAQFEHQLLVTEIGCEILTARTDKSQKFFWEDGFKPPQ